MTKKKNRYMNMNMNMSMNMNTREEKAVTIVRDVSGPVEFAEGSVVFIMPATLMARASAGHQMLMREIEERRYRTSSAVAGSDGGGGGGTLTSAALESAAHSRERGMSRERGNTSSPGGSRWNRNKVSSFFLGLMPWPIYWIGRCLLF